MAAPIQQQIASKQTIKLIVLGNVIKSISCILLLFIAKITNSRLSLTDSSLQAIKMDIFCISGLELLTNFLNKEKVQFKLIDWAKCVILMVASCVFYYVVAVVFGAPFLQHTNETFHLAILLTVTTVLPCCLALGTDIGNWVQVFVLNSYEVGGPLICYITSIMAVLGAWVGAFPIPLDWDRPWQIWPISCVIGNLIGYSGGLLLSSLYLLYRYRLLNKFKLT